MGDRIRGRKGQALLAQRLADHPLCAHCKALGIVKATAEIDHIVPLSAGGEDVDSNVQGLCVLHHAIKSATESMSAGGAANHPEWLQPSRAQLTLVSGPPLGGKSTWVDQASASGRHGLVIDLDTIAEGIRPGFCRRWDAQLLDQSIRVRNALLGSLSRQPASARAWFIVSAPTPAEVAWWQSKLQPVDHVRLDPGMAECMLRTRARTHTQREEWDEQAKVAAWYRRSKEAWRPAKAKLKRQAFDADGYPIN